MALTALTPEEVVTDHFHEPVMAGQVLEFLEPSGTGVYLDATVGGGGHTRRILEACGSCTVVAVDRDARALSEAASFLGDLAYRIQFIEGSFEAVAQTLLADDPESFAGALLDLGVSSHQLDEDARGFAFRRGVPLDMRMSGDTADAPTAADLLNEADEGRLRTIFREYGEEPRAARLAREIVRRRDRRPFATSDDLVAAFSAALDRAPSQRGKARIFQALRIAVNGELQALESALPRIRGLLADGGTLVVISYHSLEDRAVKLAFREWSASCVCPPRLPICVCRGRSLGRTLTSKPLRPTEAEIRSNPRSRSARLRAWTKVETA
ncbi:MAG: 16S rRNA (cytosine(1402)-N(4))-methyltransferase RsmH [Gemmatimonadota bacterium]|nr:MAG: 16S rRNA (cytosine(1402)-N(4))-methyltransferase RsmH [Gemmatimonadota bacterium]